MNATTRTTITQAATTTRPPDGTPARRAARGLENAPRGLIRAVAGGGRPDGVRHGGRPAGAGSRR